MGTQAQLCDLRRAKKYMELATQNVQEVVRQCETIGGENRAGGSP